MDFLAQNQLYIVMIIILAIWLGIYVYLFRLDGRLKKLEDRLGKQAPEGEGSA